MTTTHILGYPRIGPQRELKFALEHFWQGKSSGAALQSAAAQLRSANWATQRDAGLRFATVGDFALYDHMLDTAALLGALPARFGFDARSLRLEQLFALARRGAIHPAVTQVFPLDLLCQALSALHGRNVVGKVALAIQGDIP